MESLGNLYIECQVTKVAYSVDPDFEVECCRLKTQYCLTTSQTAVEFLVALLNIRPQSKYILDIASDSFIRNVKIILLMETQFLYNKDLNM